MAGSVLDFVQAMSNSAAGTVSAPVDALAWAMRKAGLPVNEPLLGSAWMERQGLTRPVQQSAASLAGETMGLLSPALAATKAPQVARGLLSMFESPAETMTYGYRSVKIRDPQALPQRPFDHDYQVASGLPASGQRLTASIDGAALDPGATVFGRRVVGGVDEGIRAGEAHRIARDLGIPVRNVPAREIAGDAGRFSTKKGTLLDPQIQLRSSMTADESERVLQHELGHAVERLSGGIPATGVKEELKHVYDFLNNRQGQSVLPRAAKKQHSPAADLYPAKDHLAELWAEAFRLYQIDPNVMKTIAPNAAKRIRAHVNRHPTLSKVVQFNSAAGVGLLGSGLLGSDPDEMQ